VADVLVLCYHAVSEDWAADLSIPPDELERQLTGLVRRGWRGATFDEAVAAAPGPRTLAVTFDDGYRSVLELAMPILSALGLPATVFVPTDHVGSEDPMAWPGIDQWLGGPHEQELIPLSWEELGGMAEAGWEIGSHTLSHPRLTGLDDARLRDELRASKAECERMTGRPCRTLAYPYGDADARVVDAARDAGYAAAAALARSMRMTSRLAFPRVGVYHPDTGWRFHAKAARATRLVRALPVWGPGPAGRLSPLRP
jgi:peptidoglycan/xylan/chitin deacetylase (PgdA/CDA1 family)